MNQQDCLQAGIDYEDGVARFVGNAAIYEKFLKSFPADKTFSELDAAMAVGDAKAAFQAGHTLKGLTGNLSLQALYRKLVPFVDALRGEGDMARAAEMYPAIQADYQKALAFILSQQA